MKRYNVIVSLFLCFCMIAGITVPVLADTLNLPSGLKVIEDEAFFGTSSVDEVVMQEGVEEIGEKAFAESGLKKVKLPKSAGRVAGNAFDAGVEIITENEGNTDGFIFIDNEDGTCSINGYTGDSAADLHIPSRNPAGKTVTAIANFAFYQRSDLTGKLILPSTITSIGKYAFSGCSKLTGELRIPDSVITIGDYAFQKCSSFSGALVLGTKVREIGSMAFDGCKGLTGSLTLPGSVRSIGSFAFEDCYGLDGVLTIPEGVTSIDGYAFYNCNKLSGTVVLPESITNLGNGILNNCKNLERIEIRTKLTEINMGSFISGCTNLKRIDLPDTIVNLGSLYISSNYSIVIYGGNAYVQNWCKENYISYNGAPVDYSPKIRNVFAQLTHFTDEYGYENYYLYLEADCDCLAYPPVSWSNAIRNLKVYYNSSSNRDGAVALNYTTNSYGGSGSSSSVFYDFEFGRVMTNVQGFDPNNFNLWLEVDNGVGSDSYYLKVDPFERSYNEAKIIFKPIDDETCMLVYNTAGSGGSLTGAYYVPETDPVSGRKVTKINLGYSSVSTVVLPEGVEELWATGLDHCSELETIYLPRSMKNIYWDPFANDPKLKEIYFYSDNSLWQRLEQYGYSDIMIDQAGSGSIQLKFVDEKNNNQPIENGSILDYNSGDSSLKVSWACDGADHYTVRALLLNEEPSGNSQEAIGTLADEQDYESNFIEFSNEQLSTGSYIKIAVQGVDAAGNKSNYPWIGFRIVRNEIPEVIEQLIQIALAEVGETEDSGGATKYGRWAGDPTGNWCAYFIAWCADQANAGNYLSTSAAKANSKSFGIPAANSVYFDQSYLNWSYNDTTFPAFLQQCTLMNRSDHKPLKGELIYFLGGTSGNSPFGHVGLVYKDCEGTTVDYIDGNGRDNTVKTRTIDLTSEKICGYGDGFASLRNNSSQGLSIMLTNANGITYNWTEGNTRTGGNDTAGRYYPNRMVENGRFANNYNDKFEFNFKISNAESVKTEFFDVNGNKAYIAVSEYGKTINQEPQCEYSASLNLTDTWWGLKLYFPNTVKPGLYTAKTTVSNSKGDSQSVTFTFSIKNATVLAPDATMQERLDEICSKTDGMYWNRKGDSEWVLIGEKNPSRKFLTVLSNKACSSDHDSYDNWYIWKYDDTWESLDDIPEGYGDMSGSSPVHSENTIKWVDRQCLGYAKMIQYYIGADEHRIGYLANTSWPGGDRILTDLEIDAIEKLEPGDHVRFESSGYHSVLVTGVTADTITVAECNYTDPTSCLVHWGRTMNKTKLYNNHTASDDGRYRNCFSWVDKYGPEDWNH